MEKETILISGATSGIGEACAKLFANTNRKLILTGRRGDRLQQLALDLSEQGAEIYTAVFDVRSAAQVAEFAATIPVAFQNIRVLVNNAGLASGLNPIQDGLLDNWDRMIDTNLKGLLYLTKAIIPFLKKVDAAQIINVGSIAGKEVYPNGNVYCASKHAVDALTRSMRIDLLNEGIRVSSVNPGLVETEFSLVRFDGDRERANQVYRDIEALQAEDIADAIRYMIESPKRINVADMVIFPACQASSRDVRR